MDDDPADVRDVLDDRPPICPACGVTMGLIVAGDEVGHQCLECGFAEDGAATGES